MKISDFCKKILGIHFNYTYQKLLLDKMYENKKMKKEIKPRRPSVLTYGNKSNVIFFDEKIF